MIPQAYQRNFNTLQQAFDAGDACLLECRELATGKPVFVICAMNRRTDGFELVPFAQLLEGNPYERLGPPNGSSNERESELPHGQSLSPAANK